MRDLDRLWQLVNEAGACERERLPPVEPPRNDSVVTSPDDQQEARQKLVLQRTGSVYYTDPNKQKRDVFRSKSKKAALNDTSSWTFSKAEKFAVFDHQIRQRESVRLAQAVLTAPSKDGFFDVNVSYVAADNGDSMATGKQNGWLGLAAERNDVDYVRLLSASGASQQSKDHALVRALEKGAVGAAQELLRNNADPNAAGVEHFMKAVADQEVEILYMFLTSVVPLQQQHLNDALIAAVGLGNTDVVALLCAHGASGDYGDGTALTVALSGEHGEDAATILSYAKEDISETSLNNAMESACALENMSKRYLFVEMLLCAGADADTSLLQDKLLEAVHTGHSSLTDLLIRHGTSPDRNNAESLRLAISQGKSETITILLRGPISRNSATVALDATTALEDVGLYEEVVTDLIVKKGVHPASLPKCLADAVGKGCGISLAPLLFSMGANIDHDDARCIRHAIQQYNTGLLVTLLKGPSQPSILCKALEDAMSIQPQSERLHIMELLLEKRVSGRLLHTALRTATESASTAAEIQLMTLLLQNKASVDFADDGGNCMCLAAAQENEKALDVLLEGEPSSDTVSTALSNLPTSFANSDSMQYEKSIRIILSLLEKGAGGPPAADKLIEAVRDDHRGKALELLLKYGADANHRNGMAIEVALRLPDIGVLEQLCRHSQLDRRTLALQLPYAMAPQHFDYQRVSLLAHTSSASGQARVLDLPLLQEVQDFGSRAEVVKLLIESGADVNFHEGKALQIAVSKGDVNTVKLLLQGHPIAAVVARAFPATMGIRDLTVRYALMEALLPVGEQGMGNEALLQAVQEADSQDLSHVVLLLQHKSSPNFREGAAVIEAIKAQNLPLLEAFVRTKLHKETLTRAFKAARAIDCGQKARRQLFACLFLSGFKGFKTSAALVEIVQRDSSDVDTALLLLEHGASVDFDDGKALQIVASQGSLHLLQIFLDKNPGKHSRNAAFHACIVSMLDPDTRMKTYQILLETRISEHFVSLALLEATREKPLGRNLLTLLIDGGASLDAADGSAVRNVTVSGDIDSLRTLLVGGIAQQQTLNGAFSACIGLERDIRILIAEQLLRKEPTVSVETVSRHLTRIVTEQDYDLLTMMIDHKADPSYNGGECLTIAARSGDHSAVQILVKVNLSPGVLDRAFTELLDKRAIQSTPNGLQVVQLLLPLEINHDLVNRALLDSFDDPIDDNTKALVETLIPYKPDFSGDSGKCFLRAARCNELDLFRRLASQSPDLNMVIPSLITCFAEGDLQAAYKLGTAVVLSEQNLDPTVKQSTVEQDWDEQLVDGNCEPILHDESVMEATDEEENKVELTAEEMLVFYLEHLEDCGARGDKQLDDSVIYTAMIAFPRGKQLIKHLLDHGCPANSKIDAQVDVSRKLFKYEPAVDSEQITAVIWAICCEDPEVSEEVIFEFLEREDNAQLSFETTASRRSALTAAGAGGRYNILKRLIGLTNDLSRTDEYGRSSSFYASRNGHLQIVEMLRAAGAEVDDGSLQESAREGHPEILGFLIANGHRGDYPSDLHADEASGRTALEELCLNSAPGEDINDWDKRIHQCIQQLLQVMGEHIRRPDGKTMLHLAFDNTNPVPATRALLGFSSVWESLNQPVHLFQDQQGYFYSPTKYVETFRNNATLEAREEVLSLLRAKKCADKFYAHTVNQPEGAVGLPEEIALAVDKRKREDNEHQEAIQRQEDLAARNRVIEDEERRRTVAADKERHQSLMRQQYELEESEKQATERKHARDRENVQHLQRERNAALKEENRLRQDALNKERAMQENERAAELMHKKNLASADYATMQTTLSMEQQLSSEKDSASQREFDRMMRTLQERRSTAKYEADERIRAAQAARAAQY